MVLILNRHVLKLNIPGLVHGRQHPPQYFGHGQGGEQPHHPRGEAGVQLSEPAAVRHTGIPAGYGNGRLYGYTSLMKVTSS